MTAGKYHRWLSVAREKYVRAHGVEDSVCERCHTPMAAAERVIRKRMKDALGRDIKPLGVSNLCETCRIGFAQFFMEPGETKKWGDFDYTQWAEDTLYPGVAYHRLTWRQRQHCYWLARTRWASDGLYRVMMSANKKDHATLRTEERERLRGLRLTLARHGCAVTFSPYTDWLDAHDYAHDHGRDAGALEGGRDDADLDGDGEGEEAA